MSQPNAPQCHLSNYRCYLPTLVAAIVLGLLIAYGTWLMMGRNVASVGTRQIVNGLLLWFVMSPVLVGLCRGLRRSRRHMTRPTAIAEP